MQPNIWLTLLLRDAGGWGQQTTSPALLTSGRACRRDDEQRREVEKKAVREDSDGGRTDDWRGPVMRLKNTETC